LISKAIDREPGYPRAYYHRAMIRHAQGSLREALADFDTELQRAPTTSRPS
jgi:Tfp pilus assembly protein PilF